MPPAGGERLTTACRRHDVCVTIRVAGHRDLGVMDGFTIRPWWLEPRWRARRANPTALRLMRRKNLSGEPAAGSRDAHDPRSAVIRISRRLSMPRPTEVGARTRRTTVQHIRQDPVGLTALHRHAILTRCGGVAQLGERDNRTVEVRGSSPLTSTTILGPAWATGGCSSAGRAQHWQC